MCVCIFFFSCIILSLLIYLSICQISLKKREENLFYHANIIKGLKVIIVKIKIEKKGGGGGGGKNIITYQSGKNKILYVIIYYFSYKLVYCNKN